MNCLDCGRSNQPDALFCDMCGSHLAATGTTQRLDACEHEWVVYHVIGYHRDFWARKCASCGTREEVPHEEVWLEAPNGSYEQQKEYQP